MKEFSYQINGSLYKVTVTKKNIRNINYRFRNNMFYVSCPIFCTNTAILNGLEKFGSKLIKRSEKMPLIADNYFYLLGKKYVNVSSFVLDNIQYHFVNEKDFYKKIKPYFIKYVGERVDYYKKLMQINNDMKVKCRYMKTRYGSNSRQTNSLDFSLILIHFKPEIIDSVVVHELAHCKVFNHKKEFYDLVYRFCPNYDTLDKKLKKNIFYD